MENGNLIDFIAYCRQQHPYDQSQPTPPSEELSIAIQHLIQRLRDCKPLKQMG